MSSTPGSFGGSALSDLDARQLLGGYGVPFVEQEIAQRTEEAVRAADRLGYPVVLKGIVSAVFHRTERGLLRTGLHDAAAVRRAADSLMRQEGDSLEGLIIQPQLPAEREFGAGLFRDPLFGPVIMFGLGGIFTETLADVSFRLAPLNEADALDLLGSLRSAALLDALRGRPPVDRGPLVRTLLGLSELAQDRPDICEIGINPLIVGRDGNVSAVDALVLQKPTEPAPPVPTAVLGEEIAELFHPESIAFIGASAQPGKWGHMLPVNVISGGFKGKVHLVNPKAGRFVGRKVYRSVTDIPGPVGLAVLTVPAAAVLELIPPLRAKGVRNVLLISAGFGETGPSGRGREAQLTAAAREAGIRIIGPNTMGICNPHNQLYCTGAPVRPLAGSTMVVSQSGNMGGQLLLFAEDQGIGIRGFCGTGNEAMITVEDFLEGLLHDPATRTVTLCIESPKNGRRFFEAARALGKQKPVVMLKGGRTAPGNRAAAGHTGALASDRGVFSDICHQAGIVEVEQPTDLLDLAAAFSSLPLPAGNRAAIVTLGGGWGVVTADLCAELGLQVPPLPEDIIRRIDPLLPDFWSRSNPIDLVGTNDISVPMTVVETLLEWEGCDALINLGIVGRRHLVKRYVEPLPHVDPSVSVGTAEMIIQTTADEETRYLEHIAALMERYGKPVFEVRLFAGENERTLHRIEGRKYKGVLYPTPERAVKAFAKMVGYRMFQQRNDVPLPRP